MSHVARGNVELLVNWKGRTNADASWMLTAELQHLYPGFKLEDELLEKGGGRCYNWYLLHTASARDQESGRTERARGGRVVS
jgi:hypothetical protein